MSIPKVKESVNPLEQYNTDITGDVEINLRNPLGNLVIREEELQIQPMGVNISTGEITVGSGIPIRDYYSQQLQNDISRMYQEQAIFGTSYSFLISDNNNIRWEPNDQIIPENTLIQSTYVFPGSITASTALDYWEERSREKKKKAKKRSPLPKWW